MILPLIGLVLGVAVAWCMPAINYDYSKYLAIAVLACLDSVFGGFAGYAENKFDKAVFVSGFFGNRMFTNFAIIRKYLLNKFKKHDNI